MNAKLLILSVCVLFVLGAAPGPETFALRESQVKEALSKYEIKEVDLLALMHVSLLSGIEEAFSYLILNDIEEKEDFYNMMYKFEQRASGFKELSGMGQEGKEALTRDFEAVTEAKEKMQKAAGEMFKSFESNKKIDIPSVRKFEREADNVIGRFDYFAEDFIEKAKIDESTIRDELVWFAMMRSDMLEAIEETWVYLILRDKSAKENYYKKINDFDRLAKKLEKSVAATGDAGIKEAYDRVMNCKERLAAAIEKLLSDFEKNRKVTKYDVRDVEDIIHEFASSYLDLFDVYMARF